MNEKSFYEGKKVLVTGGAGFIGSHLVDRLVEIGALVTVPVRRTTNLENIEHQKNTVRIIQADIGNLADCMHAVKDQEIILHLAAVCGGLGYAMKNHAAIFYENTRSFLNVIEAARKSRVERMLTTSSACVYPTLCKIPTPETEGFLGEPEPTKSGYGWSKRMAERVSRWYVEEYGMKISIARPYNTYGPRDNFDLKTSHVIPAMIRRIEEDEDPVIVLGSGNQSRSFLYITDLVQGLLEVTEKYPVGDPVNLGTDEEVTIAKLVSDICRLACKEPKIVFDTTKSEGQPRRNCDTSKAKNILGFMTKVGLEEGLKKTIEWYRTSNRSY